MYEHLINEPQRVEVDSAKPFTEGYDPVRGRPTDEYIRLWENCKKDLRR